ncbi:uncharacterized protein LOC117173798, partial [Belonocnema kinseyi]|uniref:uncharacterized protein LOC117173798 n=1 Tax=Belonocnema kinseyi TaxID=2817044 RepID=UPI00143D5CA0
MQSSHKSSWSNSRLMHKRSYSPDKSAKKNNKECPENMSLYRADENSTSVFCDCIDKHLYFLETDSCHEAYKLGPCSPGKYLLLHPGDKLAKCEVNPCHEDGLVPFEGSCARLGGPCGTNDELEMTLRINRSDFEPHCSEPE